MRRVKMKKTTQGIISDAVTLRKINHPMIEEKITTKNKVEVEIIPMVRIQKGIKTIEGHQRKNTY